MSVARINPRQSDISTLGIDESTYLTLKNSIYPGAADNSIKMVLDYCRAAKLDPIQKPVHIVPMKVKDVWRDVIMPGITLYRIQAERSGTYAGISEPTFGPLVKETIGGKEVTYPEWCRVTVRKMVQGNICEFTGFEFWKENFATNKHGQPNAMWYKRPSGQLAKCAEAQALRKAYPELGGVFTAEEMEGKELLLPHNAKPDFGELVELVELEHIDENQVAELRQKIELADSQEINICNFLKIDTIEVMTLKDFFRVCKMLDAKIQKKSRDLEVSKFFEEKEEDVCQ